MATFREENQADNEESGEFYYFFTVLIHMYQQY